ncbi:glycoside-pentoside-hexuronide (GPH):cation symporter [Alteromonas sp. M12]|uniref:MFS transporter n=1 Tax=Alteromonas sp. M12 TaxID=3135644 RepID=UPI00319DBB40
MKLESSRTERASYGAFFLGQNILFMLVFQFLNLYYTDVLGIGAAAVGILLLVARTWDAVNDPILGSIVDRCDFKGGKFLPWIKGVNFILPLSTIALFFNPNWGPDGNLLYAYASYILWGMIYTLCDVPIFALSSVMTKNSHERVIILTWGRLAALIAGITVAAATMPLISLYGWTETVTVLCIIAMLIMIPIRYFAVERIKSTKKSHSDVSLKASWNYLKNHQPMKIFYIAILISTGTNTAAIATNYFAIYNLGNGETTWVAPLMVAAMLPVFILAALTPLLIKHFGKKNLYIWGTLIGSGFSLLQYFIGYESIVVVIILQILKSAPVFLPLLLLGMFSTDFVEYGNYHNKKRLEGTVFSLQTFATKLTQALAAGICGILLGWIGYVANTEQTPEVLHGIFVLYSLVPVFGGVLSAWIMYKFYHLKESRVQEMINTTQ